MNRRELKGRRARGVRESSLGGSIQQNDLFGDRSGGRGEAEEVDAGGQAGQGQVQLMFAGAEFLGVEALSAEVVKREGTGRAGGQPGFGGGARALAQGIGENA